MSIERKLDFLLFESIPVDPAKLILSFLSRLVQPNKKKAYNRVEKTQKRFSLNREIFFFTIKMS